MTKTSDISLDVFQWTRKDYHRLVEAGILDEDSPVELLNGQILQMSPVGDYHAACVDKLSELFRDILAKSATLRVQSPIVLDDLSEPEPNLAILKRKDNFYADGHPKPSDILLVVEVADSTLAKDRLVKGPAYASSGIKEYWILNINDRQLEQYLEPKENEYQLIHFFKSGQAISSDLLGTIQVDNILP